MSNNQYTPAEEEFINNFLSAKTNDSNEDLVKHLLDGIERVKTNDVGDYDNSPILQEFDKALTDVLDQKKIYNYDELRTFLSEKVNGYSLSKESDIDYDSLQDEYEESLKKESKDSEKIESKKEEFNNPNEDNNNNLEEPQGATLFPDFIGSLGKLTGKVGSGATSLAKMSFNQAKTQVTKKVLNGKLERTEKLSDSIINDMDFIKKNKNSNDGKIKNSIKEKLSVLPNKMMEFGNNMDSISDIASNNESNKYISDKIKGFFDKNDNFTSLKDKIMENGKEEWMKEISEAAKRLGKQIANIITKILTLGKHGDSEPSPS